MSESRAELEAARARIAQLEADQERLQRSQHVQAALFRIAETASAVPDIDAFYAAIHEIVAGLMSGENFYIALYDDERGMLSFPYYRDSVDTDWPEPSQWDPIGTHFGSGLTGYVLRTGQPQHVPQERWQHLIDAGEVKLVGTKGEDWLGVPLKAEGRVLGVLVIQTYLPGERYSDDDLRLLSFVGQHVATALTRFRAIDEVRQRNAELAVINEIGSALARQLDFDATVELVGQKIREIFDARSVSIGLLDRATRTTSWTFELEEARRIHSDPQPIDTGLTRLVYETRGPVIVGTLEESDWHGAIFLGGVKHESFLGVPILAGDDVIGVIDLESLERDAFDDADARLLSTLATSMGVALENARLFDEAQRLVAETEQRNAELAVVSEIGTALVSQRDFQGVIEAVGDRASEALQANGMSICVLDPKTQELTFLYWVDEGVRNRAREGVVLGDPLSAEIVSSDRPVLIGSADEAASRGTPFAVGGTESYLGVPIPSGSRTVGVFAIGSSQKHAYDESTVRLLSTFASSMGVALENARLFLAQKKSEEEYRRLVEELPLAIYRDRPDTTSTSLYASPKTEEIFGYPAERWLEDGFFASVIHPDDRDRVAGDVQDSLETSNSKSSYTYRVIAADGRVVWVRDDSWVARDEDGNPLYINGFMLDITSQVEAAAEIRRRKQYLEALIEISPVAIVTMDRDEIVSDWNPAATRLFGYRASEAIGRSINDLLFLPDEREVGRATSQTADETGRAQLLGQRRRQDGGLVDVEIVLVPLVVDGEHTGYYAIYHDITELQAARREADAANLAKSAFLASMSHEIRTPMNAIIGMSGLLVDTRLDDEQRDFAETIRTSGEALLTIINDILDFSKIEAGRLELDVHRFDLAAAIEGAVDVVGPIAAGKGLELTFSVDPGLPRWFVGDAGRLRQIVLNLLSNAVKFTESGEVAVNVRGERVPVRGEPAWNLSLSIVDSGIGIPSDQMDRLFRSFSQADASISRRYGGTGLGLAISRRLAELMSGGLVAESGGVPGEGSTFILTLRLPESTEAGDEADASAPPSPVTLAGRRALVVDDNATNLRILVTHLERLGLDVTATTSPTEARDLAAASGFDVLLTDLRMPGLDGLELVAAVRAARPVDPPRMIIVSSLGHREHEAEAVGAWLAKPVKPAALRETLERLFGGRDDSSAGPARFVADPDLGIRHPLRVLLAEDNAVNQKLALRLLKGMGYEADLAADGFEVLEALERQPYDLVLMDVQMPDMDGLEATRRIRRQMADRSIRIVAMTANAMEGDRETCLAAGMDDYMSKPIRPGLLAAVLQATLAAGVPATEDHA